MMMLGYLGFYRMDDKIREQQQPNKRKICAKVKLTILNIISMVAIHFKPTIIANSRLSSWVADLILRWQRELAS